METKPSTDPILNRVAASQLISLDLENFYSEGIRSTIDLKDFLFQGIILKEKDFREQITKTNWSAYQDHYVAIHCTADAIVPTWAFMLLSIALRPYTRKIVFGSLSDLENALFMDALDQHDWSTYQNGKVVIKGCSKVDVPISAYVEVTNRLRPIASSIMYGEPCSTVPLYKRPKSS